jgi:hypothetical protein
MVPLFVSVTPPGKLPLIVSAGVPVLVELTKIPALIVANTGLD